MYLCITFDYELFFGENRGTYDEVLFQPTYGLIDALKNRKIAATFFADVCSIPVSQQFGQLSYIDGFTRQLQYMDQSGQDVQLHIHPHWLTSHWDGEKWAFSNEGYRLHWFEKEGRISQIIADGVGFLNDTLKPIHPEYQCIAYRAGGFSLQPHHEIVKALYDNGIRVDSSVVPQMVIHSDAQIYDYQHKLETMNWHMSDQAEWWQDSKEGKYLVEVPVATVDKSPVDFLLKRVFTPEKIKLSLGPKRGTYIPIHTEPKPRLKAYLEYISDYNLISMDAYAAEFLYDQVKRFKKKTNCQAAALIGHPKLVTQAYIDNLNRFIDLIQRDDQFEFASVHDVYYLKGIQ